MIWGAACQNAVYLAAICDLELAPCRVAIWEIAQLKRCDFAFAFGRPLSNSGSSWRVPNPPGANPLVAERAPWRSSQSCVTRGQQPIGKIHTDSCHFFCTPGNPCATAIVVRGEGSFRYQGVSTRGVRHLPEFSGSGCKGNSLVSKVSGP